MARDPLEHLEHLLNEFATAHYNAAVQEHVEGFTVENIGHNERTEIVSLFVGYWRKLENILEAAYKFDDKPHHLYSAIGAAATLHEHAPEIRRLMNEAYDRKGLSPVFRHRDV